MSDLAGKSLDELARIVRASAVDYRSRELPRPLWVEAACSLCVSYAEASSRFGTQQRPFGQWLRASGVEAVMSASLRWSAGALGRLGVEQARELIANSRLRSLQRIASEEADLVYVRRDGERRGSAQKERARAAIRELKAAGEAVTYKSVAKKAGTSSTPVRVALAEEQAEKRIIAERLSETAQQRFDRLLAKAIAEQEARLRYEIGIEVHEYWDNHVVKRFAEQLDRARKVNAAHRGFVEQAKYRQLLAFLHPDNHLDDVAKTRGAELFRLMAALRDVLEIVPTKSERMGIDPLPLSYEELLARKHALDEARRRQRGAAKAARAV